VILLLQISVDQVPDTVHSTLIIQQIEDRIDRDPLAVDEIISLCDHIMIVSSVNRSARNRKIGVDRVLTVREKKALLLIKNHFSHKNFAPFKFSQSFVFIGHNRQVTPF
jgi:putative hemolysin